MNRLDKFKKPIVDLYGKEPETLDELAECVIKVMNQHGEVLGFQWDMWYSTCVSNTDSSPIGKPTNWGSNDNLPRGYPGWAGRVWFRIRARESFGSEVLANTLTYTGTGGFGSYSGPWENISEALYELYIVNKKNKYKNLYKELYIYSYNYRFYEDDWPEVDKIDRMVRKLKGIEVFPKHFFSWTHPDVLAQDTKYIDEYHDLKKRQLIKA